MPRYIDVSAYVDTLNEVQIEGAETYKGLGLAKKIALETPAADVQEVRHGGCSMCNGDEMSLRNKYTGYEINIDTKRQELNVWCGDECIANIHIDYCPNCGAKLNKKE